MYQEFLDRALYIQQTVGEGLTNGAADEVYVKGEMKILPAEIAGIHQSATELIGSDSPRRALSLNHKVRESTFVWLATNAEKMHNGDQVIAVVFGGLHEFSDGLQAYNMTHPGNEFSLTVVTPIGYTESYKKMIHDVLQKFPE